MDNLPDQPSTQPPSGGVNILIIIASLILAFISGGISGYLLSPSFNKSSQRAATQPTVDQSKLPATVETLQSPIITEWSGHVEGRLIQKDSKEFILEKAGHTLTIAIHPKLTGFQSATEVAVVNPSVPYEQVPIGSYLRGSITIMPRTEGRVIGEREEYVIGNTFDVVELPPQ